MIIGTVDEMIALLELERDRLGGAAPVRMVQCFSDGTSIPFVSEASLRKDGTYASRKTAISCVLIAWGPL